MILLLAAPSVAENLVLINGTIIDGTGKPRVAGSVRVRDGKIADIGLFKPMPGEEVIDVKGLIVAPGFIDLENSDPSSQLQRGITTTLRGADGTGPYAIEEFMNPFDEKPPLVNFAVLVGHATIRRQIMGNDYKRAATADEIRSMADLVGDAMRQGAFGFASDLRADVTAASALDEIQALAKAAARFGGTVLLHPRADTVKEAIDVAREAKTSVEVSFTNLTAVVLAEIAKARTQGIDIGIHDYAVSLPAATDSSVSILLRQYQGNERSATLERSVQKMSSVPASRAGFKERGTLKKGFPADIVVLNPATPAAAVKYVFVNGTLAVKESQGVGVPSGQALR